ncbi:MAG: protein kinase [Chloroflexota bacterium]
MSTSLIGQTIGRYKIVDHLGKGGMAEVYKGLQESLDRYVAIKLMHTFLITEEDFLKRFQREAKAMASMSHPNIVRVFDFDVYGENSYYLVMEFIDGGTLKEYLEDFNSRGERLPMQDAVRICTEIADALAYAHRRQMVHRDIKPANVMLDRESGKAILTDFGIVKMVGNQSMAYTATGALIGTPAYMSPEQALGQPGDERVDIYSLGVMIFQMVTGQLPFDAETPLAVVMKHVNDLPPLPMDFNEEVPLDLQEVILKALAKQPNDRYQTAKELADALRAVNFSGPRATSAANIPATTPSSPTLPNPSIPQNTITGARLAQEAEKQAAQNEETAASQTAPAPPATKKRPGWLIPAIVGVVALLAVGIFFIISNNGAGGSTTVTPVPVVAVPDDDPTDTPEPEEETAVPTETNTPEPTLDPFDIARTVSAENALTREAGFTATPTKTSTPTITPSPTPTVDGTRAFLESCTIDYELVSANRSGFNSNFVPVDVTFSIAFVLRNNGTCPWNPGVSWDYVEGDDLGFEEGDAVIINESVEPGEEIEIIARLGPVPGPNAFNSSWQLFGQSGQRIGDPTSFEIRSFLPATATPIPTDTPEAPVTTVGDDWRANWVFDVSFCEYTDTINWRCTVTIYPYIDGTGAQGQVGQFTVSIFDQPGGQAATYRGVGPFEHQVIFRRCNIYNTEIRVVDDVTSTEAAVRALTVDPNQHFEGGCQE